MINVIAFRRTDRTRGIRALVSALVAELRPSAAQAATAPAPAAVEPAELPAVEDIEQAARAYFRASDQARAADRAKRAAKKVLDRVPVGCFGGWLVEREPSARQTVDLEQVRATYKRLGLGEVPMKTSAPSLRITRVESDVLSPSSGDMEFAALAAAMTR